MNKNNKAVSLYQLDNLSDQISTELDRFDNSTWHT